MQNEINKLQKELIEDEKKYQELKAIADEAKKKSSDAFSIIKAKKKLIKKIKDDLKEAKKNKQQAVCFAINEEARLKCIEEFGTDDIVIILTDGKYIDEEAERTYKRLNRYRKDNIVSFEYLYVLLYKDIVSVKYVADKINVTTTSISSNFKIFKRQTIDFRSRYDDLETKINTIKDLYDSKLSGTFYDNIQLDMSDVKSILKQHEKSHFFSMFLNRYNELVEANVKKNQGSYAFAIFNYDYILIDDILELAKDKDKMQEKIINLDMQLKDYKQQALDFVLGI